MPKKFCLENYVPGVSNILEVKFNLIRFLRKYACDSNDRSNLITYLCENDLTLISLSDLARIIREKKVKLKDKNTAWLFSRLVDHFDISDSDITIIMIVALETIRDETLLYRNFLYTDRGMDNPDRQLIIMNGLIQNDLDYLMSFYSTVESHIGNCQNIIKMFLEKQFSWFSLKEKLSRIRRYTQVLDYIAIHPGWLSAAEWNKTLRMLEDSGFVLRVHSFGSRCKNIRYEVSGNEIETSGRSFPGSDSMYKAIMLAFVRMSYSEFTRMI